MSFRDALRVVKKRGEAMQAAAEATPSGMVAVLMLDREKVEAICEQAHASGPVRRQPALPRQHGRVWHALRQCGGRETRH
jgi:malonyl CoA-acyl carrier protein transacylase